MSNMNLKLTIFGMEVLDIDANISTEDFDKFIQLFMESMKRRNREEALSIDDAVKIVVADIQKDRFRAGDFSLIEKAGLAEYIVYKYMTGTIIENTVKDALLECNTKISLSSTGRFYQRIGNNDLARSFRSKALLANSTNAQND